MKNIKIVIIILITTIIAALVILNYGQIQLPALKKGNTQKACTMEAKLCDDGSSVGRSGPNCEFAPCPMQKDCELAGQSADEYSFGKYVGPKKCCEGLTKIRDEEYQDGKCAVKFDRSTICSNCGNNICEKWENLCNCSADCIKEEGSLKDWQTYRNEELGFELQYPAYLKVTTDKDAVNFHKDCSSLRNGDNLVASMECDLESDMTIGTYNKTIDEFIEEFKGDFMDGEPLTRIVSQENYTLDNVSGKKLEGNNAEGVGGGYYIYVTKNNKNYLISYMDDTPSDFQVKMISTFKFTDTPEYKATDWQTYINKECGYEIKYPKDYIASFKFPENISFNSPKNEQRKKDIASGKMYGEGYMEDINVSYVADIKNELENKYNNLHATTLLDFVNKNPLISNKKEIDFAGEKAWSVTRGGFGAYYTIMFIHNGHFYQILFGNKDTASKLSDTENKILSTFKFTK